MGLLDNALQAIKNQYQETKGNVGLLMSDPKQYMSGLNQDAAEYNRLSSLALQAERNAYRGIPVSQEQAAAKQYIDQQQQDMALGFAAPIAYHGTTKPISQLNPKKSFGDLNVSWVSPNPEFASRYASREGGNVMPLEVNEGKVFDFADKKSLDKLTKKASNVQIYDPIRGSTTLDKFVPNAGESYKTAENPQLFNLIKKMGYDSVAVYEDGVRNLGIFNPKKNIKSKFE